MDREKLEKMIRELPTGDQAEFRRRIAVITESIMKEAGPLANGLSDRLIDVTCEIRNRWAKEGKDSTILSNAVVQALVRFNTAIMARLITDMSNPENRSQEKLSAVAEETQKGVSILFNELCNRHLTGGMSFLNVRHAHTPDWN